MNKSILGIVGLVLVGVSVVFGLVFNFDYAWIVSIISASAGIALLIKEEAEKQPDGKQWVSFAVAFGTVLGTMVAVMGGTSEATLLEFAGAVLTITSIVIGVLVQNGIITVGEDTSE